MALKATTLRMSEDLWELLEEEAARQGVSAAHVVRDSVLLRLGHLSAARGDSAAQMTIEQLAAARCRSDTATKARHTPRRLASHTGLRRCVRLGSSTDQQILACRRSRTCAQSYSTSPSR